MGYCYGAPIETTVQTSDQLQLYSTVQGQPRRASVSALADAVENLHPTPTGILDLSSFYVMRGTGLAIPVALTTTPIPLPATAYTGSFALPTGRSSLQADPTNGRFIATRDIAAFEFTVGITGDWTNGTTITMALQAGDPLNLFTSAFQWSMLGVGPSLTLSGSYSGPASNLNDTQGVLRAGQIIRVVASLSSPGTLNLQRVAFAVRPLDGK